MLLVIRIKPPSVPQEIVWDKEKQQAWFHDRFPALMREEIDKNLSLAQDVLDKHGGHIVSCDLSAISPDGFSFTLQTTEAGALALRGIFSDVFLERSDDSMREYEIQLYPPPIPEELKNGEREKISEWLAHDKPRFEQERTRQFLPLIKEILEKEGGACWICADHVTMHMVTTSAGADAVKHIDGIYEVRPYEPFTKM